MKILPRLLPLLGAALVLGPAVLVAGTIAPFTPFVNGQAASAADLNARIDALRVSVNEATAVGDVAASVLTEAQFQSLRGTGWVLADGRSATGTTYATRTGQTNIPDLRGLFLRGRNNGRNDGKQNPDGEFAIGAYQADENKSHEHGFTFQSSGGLTPPNVFPTWTATYAQSVNQGVGRGIAPTGGNELRPRNGTVNYFIRVD